MSRPRLLVIDRDPFVPWQIRRLLDGAFEIDETYSGFLGLAQLRRHSYDLVIASLEMPRGLRGARIIRHIRMLPGYEAVPLIGLATDEAETAVGEIRCELACFFVKPLPLKELGRVLRGFLPAASPLGTRI